MVYTNNISNHNEREIMNTTTETKEITFKLFYRKAWKPGMVSVEEATATVAAFARKEGWAFKFMTVDRFGRLIYASSRKPAYAWEDVATRAGLTI